MKQPPDEPPPSAGKSGQLFEALLKVAKASPNGKIVPRKETGLIPLSVAQQRLWFLEQLEPGSPTYNIVRILRLTGPLDVPVLEQTLAEIMQRHEILRTNFQTVDGRPVAVVRPALTVEESGPSSVPLSQVDLRHLPESERTARMEQLVTRESRQPFNLAEGPLMRLTLLRLGAEEQILCLVMHHTISDGWSITVFFRELACLYRAFQAGTPSPLPALPVQYGDYAIWQREWLQSEALDEQLAYWKKQLEDMPAGLELPTDYPRPPIKSFRGAYELRVLDRKLTRLLRAFSQAEGVTLFMLLLAAFKVLLYRYTGQQDIVVGTPIANRNRAQIDKLIGVFVNSLVLRTHLTARLAFRDLLAQVRDVALEAYAHQDLPFEKLLEALQPHRDLSHTPLFQIFFNMQNFEGQQLDLPGLTTERILPPEPDSKFDLTLYVVESDQAIQLQLVYNTDLFRGERMAEFLVQFERLLRLAVADPDEKITGLSLVTPRARSLLPDPTQDLCADWEGAIHTQLSRQAQTVPDRIAVKDKQSSWTYQELNARSNQLAQYLIARGVQPQEVVAIYGHRSAALVWAILGVLKAGAAFLILDPAYPASRLKAYLCQAQPRAWLQLEAAGSLPETVTACLDQLPCRGRLLLPQRETPFPYDLLGEYATIDPDISIEPDDLAFVSFTSGSTGQPKAVLGRHGPLTHFLPWQAEKFKLTADDRFSMLSGLSHDPLQRDVFTALWLGAILCIPDPGLDRLADWMAQEEITFAHLTPAMAQILTETISADSTLPALRYAFFVGDKLSQRDVARLRRLAPSVTCINSYGATETQRAVSYYVVPPDQAARRTKAVYPLGKGMPDVQLLVLNDERQLAGIGELGEIYVRSPHLARGYLADEALTEVRFLTNPFTGEPEDRLYRTGDLGRYLPDGTVEFAGRNDQQVKVRGFRIELGEIEAVLARHPAVRESVLLAHTNSVDQIELAAYVVSAHRSRPTVSELHRFLKQSVPDYMIPAAFAFLDRLPLTPNGKVDYQALPAPDQTRPDLASGFLAPRNTLELQLVKVWEQILGIQPVGVRDNFFELGGHSLLAVRMVAQVEQTTGRTLSLALLFQAPTVAQLAAILQEEKRLSPPSSLVPIQTDGTNPPVFCVPGNLGNVFTDLGHLAQHLDLEQPFYGFQDGPHNPAQVETLAADYIKEIRHVQPEGPYLLAGICSGGAIAFEMAQQLQAAGQRVDLLALVEPSYPRIASLRTYVDFALSIIRRFTRRAGHQSRRMSAMDKTEWGTYLKLKIKMVANLWAINRYAPRPYAGRIDLFLTQESLQSREQPRFNWRNFTTAQAVLHRIAGTHNIITGTDDTEIEEAVMEDLAKRLMDCINEVLADNGNN